MSAKRSLEEQLAEVKRERDQLQAEYDSCSLEVSKAWMELDIIGERCRTAETRAERIQVALRELVVAVVECDSTCPICGAGAKANGDHNCPDECPVAKADAAIADATGREGVPK